METLRIDDPRWVGPYRLHSRLGRGAMGTVYLASSPGGRPIAVKVTRTELAGDPSFRDRFRREATMARSVGGFWTAAVVDADPDAPRPWLATEYVAGPTLQAAIDEHGPLPEPAVRQLAAGLAEALAAIHGAGLIHRDLKPSNILLGPDGPRVIDFGISRALTHTKLTATGSMLGTPGFLSPEQIAGAEIGPPSDVFSLGVVLVYAATGDSPFGVGPASALLYRAVHAQPDLEHVPHGVRQIVADCLRQDPGDRPTSAQLLDRLGREHHGMSDSARWLPSPVQAVIDRRATDLRATLSSAGSNTSTVAVPPPTKAYTSAVAAESAGPDASVDGTATAGRGAEFRTSRWSAALWGAAGLFGALVTARVADVRSGAGELVRLLALVVSVLFVIAVVRLTVAAIRPRHELSLTSDDLVIAKGRRTWHLPWRAIERIRVEEHRSKPWVVVWLAEGWAVPNVLRDSRFATSHGGLRIFPVGHERLRRRRAQEVTELRAALAWHAPQAFDERS